MVHWKKIGKGYSLFLIVVLSACDGRNGGDTFADGNYVTRDDKYVYATLTREHKKNGRVRQVVLKIPREYIGRARGGMVSVYAVWPDLSPYFELENKYRKNKDVLIELNKNKLIMSISHLPEVWSYVGISIADIGLSRVGEGPYGLNHFKWKGCEGKPFDRSLLKNPSFEDGCYSLNRSEYYISGALSGGRSVFMICDTRCKASTALTVDGFKLSYSFLPDHLSRWREIDSTVFTLFQGFVISNTVLKDEKTIGSV